MISSTTRKPLFVLLYFIVLVIVLYFIGTIILEKTSQETFSFSQTHNLPHLKNNKDSVRPNDSMKVNPNNNDSRNITNSRNHPNLMCLIFTTVEQYDRKGLAVKLTWAKRCDIYAFFYSKKEHVTLQGAYPLDVPEGREHLTAKTMKAFSVAYSKYQNEIDWYVKADDDTYFIMENLRHLLQDYDPNKPYYLGHKSSDFLRKGYNSGGAGYILSKKTVELIIEKGDAFPSACPVEGGIEDFDMGRCLESFRIYPDDTRDDSGRIKFHPDHPLKLLLGEKDTAYQYNLQNYTFGNHQGIKVLSPETVSFHYMEPGHMYMYDFLLYKLKRHSIE